MKVTLDMYEMQDILDDIHQNAYDKLQGALEKKLCRTIHEDDWLKIWEEGDWEIEMILKLKERTK